MKGKEGVSRAQCSDKLKEKANQAHKPSRSGWLSVHLCPDLTRKTQTVLDEARTASSPAREEKQSSLTWRVTVCWSQHLQESTWRRRRRRRDVTRCMISERDQPRGSQRTATDALQADRRLLPECAAELVTAGDSRRRPVVGLIMRRTVHLKGSVHVVACSER